MARFRPTVLAGLGASAPISNVSATEWSEAKDSIAKVAPLAAPMPNEFSANIAGQTVWVKMPYLDPTMTQFGMSEANTDLENDAALLATVNAAVAIGATVRIPAGDFALRQFNAPYGTIIEGAGKENTRFIRSVGNAADRFTFKALGSAGATIPLAADTVSGATSLTVATDPGLVSGDVVFVTDLRAPWGGAKYPGMDMARVVAVSGTGPYTVHLGDALYHPFSTALSATMKKVTPWRGGFHGFTIDVQGVIDGNGIILEYGGEKAEIGDVHVNGWRTTALATLSSYRSKLDRTSVANPSSSASGYGYGHLVDMGSRGVDIGYGESRKARHGFDISGGSSDNIVHDSTGYSPGLGPDFDTHGVECYYNSFVNCKAYTGTFNRGFSAGNATFGGDFFTHFDRCTGSGAGPGGDANPMFRAILGSHGMRVTSCLVRGGYYGVQASQSNDVAVTGNTIINTRAAVFNQSSLGMIVNANTFDTTEISAVQAAAGLSSCDGMIVTNNQGVNTPTPLANLAGTGHQTASNVLR